MRKQRDAQDILPLPVRVVVIAILLAIALIPIAYTLLLSVTPDTEISTGSLIPSQWAFSNYIEMWSTVSLAQGMSNSLIISGIASVIAVALAVGAAYVITRFKFRGRLIYLYSLIGLQTVPGVMLLLPIFVLFSSIQALLHLKLVGTYPAVIITDLTFALPFATWLMVSYLGSIPVDLEEAALVDGATRLQALWRVIVPLALPGMVVALVFSFLAGWNDVLFASVLTSPETRTIAVQLQAFSSAQEGGALPLYGQLMGAAIVSALPVVILYMVFQRYLVGGLTAGGVKG
ncbi:carbohydrate ABC transporter permease [Ktedonobacter racemifer]|uniref:Binding-protein-dependent transport systems inner membrane component n=1 Tax=Ktedonobacter racemifer DSM 44963 TaxID=485913 RepID=D6U0Y4_KTERA|nr:carbohydrate ABC transporter permease [Ktedonobacter racemifer]EFH82474.1 binding-protein-dependent transport systems inner membrane component [Ktedonobacter racemifer DSM 44963]